MLVQDNAQIQRPHFYVGPWNIPKGPQYLQQKVPKCAVQHCSCVDQPTKTRFIWLYVRKSQISRKRGKTLWPPSPHYWFAQNDIDKNIKVSTSHSYTIFVYD